jgi:hypothetical protein
MAQFSKILPVRDKHIVILLQASPRHNPSKAALDFGSGQQGLLDHKVGLFTVQRKLSQGAKLREQVGLSHRRKGCDY